MRVVLLILLLANLGLYVWHSGLLSVVRGGHEPERLARQIDPGSIRVMAPDEARPPVCRRVSGLDEAQAQALQQWLADRPGVQLDLVAIGVSEHLVLIPALANAAAAAKKQTELRALGIADAKLSEGGDSGPLALVLGVFADEVAARRRLDELAARGVRSARVQPRVRESQISEARLRLRGPAGPRIDDELGRWVAERPGLQWARDIDCPAR